MAHVLVLTASDGRGLSDAELAQAARETGGTARRLTPAAGEVGLDSAPPRTALDALADRFGAVDVNLVPAAGRKKAILIADMDCTMISVECIDEIADFAGVKPQVAAITERAMAGELDFVEALNERVSLLKGLAEATLDQVYAERVSLNPGARRLVRTMRAHGAETQLVSGGFTFFAERVADATGFARHLANRLLAEDGRLNGRVGEPVVGRQTKLDVLRALAAERGVGLDAALAVGDGANDLAMVEAAGLGVAFRPKPALAAGADAVIRHGGLDALLALQGYRAEEHVTD